MKRESTAKSPPEERLPIDAKTQDRKEKLYANGDYQRIADKANANRWAVRNAFIVGSAPKSVAKEIMKYYAAKEQAMKRLSA